MGGPIERLGASGSQLVGLDLSGDDIEADDLAQRMRDAAYELRHGRGDASSARSMLQQAGMLISGRRPGSWQTALVDAGRELGPVVEAAESRATPSLPNRVAPSPAHREAHVMARLAHHIGGSEAEVRQAVGEHLFRTGPMRAATLRALAHTSPAHLARMLRRGGASEEAVRTAIDEVHHQAGLAFHSRAVGVASEGLSRLRDELDRAQHGRALDRFVAHLRGRPGEAMLRALSALGAGDDVVAIRAQLKSRDGGSAAELRIAVARALRTAAPRVDAIREEIGQYEYDPIGIFNRKYPSANERLARELGISPEVVRGGSSGRSVLEDAAAEYVRQGQDGNESAEDWAAASALVGGILMGGGVVAALAGAGQNLLAAGASLDEADDVGVNVAAGLDEPGHVDALRRHASAEVIDAAIGIVSARFPLEVPAPAIGVDTQVAGGTQLLRAAARRVEAKVVEADPEVARAIAGRAIGRGEADLAREDANERATARPSDPAHRAHSARR